MKHHLHFRYARMRTIGVCGAAAYTAAMGQTYQRIMTLKDIRQQNKLAGQA